jgi:dipeptidyl aminopeptidase/acylaminoacyl peptidase
MHGPASEPSSRSTAAVLLTILALVTFLAGVPSAARAQETRAAPKSERLTLDKYMHMEGVRDPKLSPSGREIAYVRSWIDPMTDAHKSAVWMMNADGSRNRYLAEGSSPRWSPGGARLAFLACGTAGGDRSALDDCPKGSHRQIYVRIMEGTGAGSITQVTRLTESASDLAWSPDGARLAFRSFVPSREKWTIDLPHRPEGARWTPDPRVVDRLDYRADRRGFLPKGFSHLFTVPSTGGTPRQITDGSWNDGAPAWSPDGKTLYFSGLRLPDADYHLRESEVYAVDVASKQVRQLTHRHGPDHSPVVSPDGRRIAYVGVDSSHWTYSVQKLYVMGADGSAPHAVEGDLDRSPSDVTWAPGSDGVYFTVADHGVHDVFFADLEGHVRRVTRGEHVLSLSDIGKNGTAVGVMSTPDRPGDIVSFALDHPDPRWLTTVNRDVLGDVELGDVQEIEFRSKDGLPIQGWIVKPPDFDPARKYPLILHIHGGPWAMYGVGFNFSFQNFAANDYVVLYVNPRGSTGYGSDFVHGIEHAYPGKDFDDLMAGVDEVVKRGYVNPKDLYVTGCSGGGALSAWTVGHTHRFAAAVVRCPVIDWLSFVGTTDGPYWYHNFARFPWEDPAEHLERSPLTYAGNVTTPTLLMTGVLDMRTPISQTEEFYDALKIRKVPTKMIRMNREYHGTGSQPSNFLRTQLYIMKWFGEYMTDDVAAGRKDGHLTGGA